MTAPPAHGWFITGTDTDAGKTVVSAALVLGLKAHYWKPVQTGSPTDSEYVAQWTDIGAERIHTEAWRLPLPASPHWAARQAGRRIALEDLRWPEAPAETVWIVEGAGGARAPLNERECMTELMMRLGLPAIVVARQRLGAINHTLLTLEALERRGIAIAGVILNHGGSGCVANASGPETSIAADDPLGGNRGAIEETGGVRVLAELPPIAPLDPPHLQAAYDRYLRAAFSNIQA